MPNGEVSRRFPHSYASAGEARQFVAETFGGWGLHQLVADACLVASELVTNVVRHARSDIAVALSRVPGAARVAVGDADPRPPIRRDPASSVPEGRGLKVVEALTRRWGCESVPGGKVVWADLPLDVDRATATPA